MLTTAVTVAQILVVCLLASWIALEKRPPVATLAWIGLVVALPVAGALLYYFIGHRRVKRTRFKRLRARLGLRAAREKLRETAGPSGRTALDARALQLMRLATEVSDSPPSNASAVRLLIGGDETFAAIEEAIRGARHHVHLEYYIFEPDTVGTRRSAISSSSAPAPASRCACSATAWGPTTSTAASSPPCARPAPASPGSAR